MSAISPTFNSSDHSLTTLQTPPRSIILVLGMHRSGTSALTGLLRFLNVQLGENLLTGSADNPTGYWEVQPINQLNSRLLASAGTAWNDLQPISEAWFSEAARGEARDEALALMDQEFGPSWRMSGGGPLLLKDPRITRLLPFWVPLLRDEGLQVHAILMIRSPLEVAMSLRARCQDVALRPWGIESLSLSLLLWLRYQLDCILDCDRVGLNPVVFDYQYLRAGPSRLLNDLCGKYAFPLESPSPEAVSLIGSFVRPEFYRQRADSCFDAAPVGCSTVTSIYRNLSCIASLSDLKSSLFEFQDLAASLNDLCGAHRSRHPSSDLSVDDDFWAATILEALSAAELSP